MLCITETWLNFDVLAAEVSLENYNIFRVGQQSGKWGGGVARYAKSEPLPRGFSLDFNVDSSFVGVVACQIPYPFQLFTVLGAYRSLTTPEAADEQIIRAIRLVANKQGICLILGDFNAPHINWQTGSSSVSNGFSMKPFEIGEFLF